ncbi:UTP--glucose-1-phosphate uridylyltransferase isoform X1 [Pyrus x bretschneideri]|uniref:UTP--glucose-1-phosphate uridylyltransferase isoform X1 n=1 Tax=Pyrus x bretschneideri TaxID=225117 RepID=UPI00202E1454|nr:UTP--glucose-1-phosphate uridylyltransferase isoform X1 [Pyrus x bretschneideri]
MTLHSIVIQKLLSTNAHLGRRVAAHHFKQFTYGTRNGMAIIDSDRTLICLRSAAAFIAALAQQKARFMFVNTNSLWDEIIEQMTKKIGCYSPSMNMLWRTGGFLTNSHSPKKFRSRHKKICFGPTQPPDCLVVFDTDRKSSVILEADRLQIPIVSLVDSAMPLEYYKKITYPIPANESVQFVYLVCNLITKTFLLQQKRNGAVAVEEETREQVESTEESKSTNKAELLVLPYNLLPISPGVEETEELLDKLVVLKFNGASGTSLGFHGPKSAIEIRDGLTSLGLIVKQIESLRSKYRCSVPLLLMNTPTTHEDTVKVVEKYSNSNIDIHSLKQTQQPQLKSHGVEQGGEDELYPSGHGALFLSLVKSGTLDVLLSQGKEYILLVNSANVAATIDPKILNHLIENKIEYCMEVTPTFYDSDFNNIGSRLQKFELAEIAQNFVKHSMDKFKLVDTGSLWVNLKAVKRLLDTDALKIEDIPVSKGTDSDEIPLQETAAGSAIRFFDRAIGINVPHSRSLSINKTSDLLLLKSDIYICDEGVLVRNIARTNPKDPLIELGPQFEKVSDLLSRFKSIPDIIDLDSLKVTGDVWFGAGITLKGKVTIIAKPGVKLEIPDGLVIENKDINDPSDI